jgi:plasmid maintenance system antidote protein VapI
MEHAQIFRDLLKQESIAQKTLVEISGMHPSKISRFLNGVIDLTAGEFFSLLALMPSSFQQKYWKRFLGAVDLGEADEEINILPLIEKLPPLEQIRIMRAIANRGKLFEQDNQKSIREEQELVHSV